MLLLPLLLLLPLHFCAGQGIPSGDECNRKGNAAQSEVVSVMQACAGGG